MLKKILSFVVFSLFLSLLFIFYISFFVFIMRFLGFRYDSLLSVFIFFILAEIIAYPLEKGLKYLTKKIIKYKMTSIKTLKILYIFAYTNITFLVMSVIDYFMPSIYASGLDFFAISLIASFISLKIDILEK